MFKLFSAIIGVNKDQIVPCPSCNCSIIENATMCIHCGSPIREIPNRTKAETAPDGSSRIESS